MKEALNGIISGTPTHCGASLNRRWLLRLRVPDAGATNGATANGRRYIVVCAHGECLHS